MEMPLYLHFVFAFLSTVGYSIFFNVPKQQLVYCGLTGATGWMVYTISNTVLVNPVFSNFLAALTVTLMSEKLARKLKKPAILFVIPGIIPLVPGSGLYKTMLNFVQGDYNLAISKGIETVLVSGAIALGIMVTTSINTSIRIYKNKIANIHRRSKKKIKNKLQNRNNKENNKQDKIV